MSSLHVEIRIEKSVPSADWLRVATKRAKANLRDRGGDWLDSTVTVILPEPGRCFTKASGQSSLIAHG